MSETGSTPAPPLPCPTGMVLGKFMPPHRGHVYLVEFARRYCLSRSAEGAAVRLSRSAEGAAVRLSRSAEGAAVRLSRSAEGAAVRPSRSAEGAAVVDLTVVVGSLAREPIPGALRHQWMRQLFPDLRVVHLTDENPQEPHEHPDFWRIWRDSLLRVLPAPPDLVFASERYGWQLAQVLGATFVPVDLQRGVMPVSGTAVRDDPVAHWQYLPACVRPYFLKRVCIFGPESTGKTTLARLLAQRFGTIWVPEYARSYLEARNEHDGRDCQLTAADLERIARGQLASEDALCSEATRVLFCDTDVLATTLWSTALLGTCAPWIQDQADRRDYDLYLLTDVDVPFVPDPVRYLPAERASFFARCEDALRARGRRYLRLSGPFDERLDRACSAVEELLHGPAGRLPGCRQP